MMKRFFIPILTILLSLSCYAKDNTKDFIKLIKKHDVSVKARDLPSDASPNEFWNAVLDNNPHLVKLSKDISKKKGAEKEAISNIERMKLWDYKLIVNIMPEYDKYCDSLMIEMGLPQEIVELHVINDSTSNALTMLTKTGFAICLNIGLLERLEYDSSRIKAVTAHEFTHGAFFHHLKTEYDLAKQKRKDNVTSGFLLGGITALMITANVYDDQPDDHKKNHERRPPEDIEITIDDKRESLQKYVYKFSEEDELEADLVALRFMQFIGESEKYQEALQLTSTSNAYFWYDDDTAQPPTSYRLEFLDFVLKNPQYVNEVKIKEEKNYDELSNLRFTNLP